MSLIKAKEYLKEYKRLVLQNGLMFVKLLTIKYK